LDKYRYDTLSARYEQKAGHDSMDIYVAGGNHFVLEPSASFRQIENEAKCLPSPSFGEVSSVSFQWKLNVCHAPSKILQGFFSFISTD